jgi:hypothetical protein
MIQQGPFSLITANREPEAEPLVFHLNPLLQRLTADQLGFDPRRIPSAVETKIPFRHIQSQLPSGRVVVPLSVVIAGLDDRLQPAFSKANPSLPIELPIQEVIAQLPDLPEEEEEAPMEAAPQAPAAASPFRPSPFQPPPPVVVTHEASPTGLWEDEQVPAAPAMPTPFKPLAAFKPAPAHPASAQPAPAPVINAPAPSGPVSLQANPNPSRHEEHAPVQAPKPSQSGSVHKSGLNLVTHIDDSPEQMILRAVLGTSEPLSARQVLGHASRIPGVLSVVGIHEGQAVWPDIAPPDGLTQEFADTASQRYYKVRELLLEFGTDQFEIFTVNLGSQTISFFSAPDCALAVLHKEARLPSGVCEKMVVIARHLGALLRS